MTQTGYNSPTLEVRPGSTASNGVAVGRASSFVNNTGRGARPIRWDSSGTLEMGVLGVSFGDFNSSTTPYAINEDGTFTVGYGFAYDNSNTYKGERPIRWDAAGNATELGNLGVRSSNGTTGAYAYAVNNAGTAVGSGLKVISGVATYGDRAIRWDASGTAATELGHLGTDGTGYTAAYAYYINESGTAAGQAYRYVSGVNKGYRATRWDSSGTTATELDHLNNDGTGTTQTGAHAINAPGTVAGWGNKYEGANWRGTRAIRWAAGGTTATELGHLGVASNNQQTFSEAYALNDDDTAVGYARRWSFSTSLGDRAVRWLASGTAAEELGNLGTAQNGYTNSYANAINNDGIIVGWAEDYNESGSFLDVRAVLWGADGVAVDLNTLLAPNSGWVNLYEARDISNTNWITGYGVFDPDGAGGVEAYDRMFLMQYAPIPEPTTLGLLGVGTVGLIRRRRAV